MGKEETLADVQLVARNEVAAENSCIPPMTVSSAAAGIVARRLGFDLGSWQEGVSEGRGCSIHTPRVCAGKGWGT